MTQNVVLSAVRDCYVRALAAAVAAHQPCHIEPALRRRDGTLAVEGPLNTPCRVDLIGKKTGTRVRVDAPNRLPDTPVEFRVDGIQVHVNPFSWDWVRVVAQPVREGDLSFLSRWFSEWFDPEDTHGPDEQGLYRVVHYLSDPELTDGTLRFVVDFGSAGIEAFEDLMQTLGRAGVTTVAIE